MCIRDSTKPFNEISGVVSQIQGALASARRIFDLLDLPDEDADDEMARVVGVGDVYKRQVWGCAVKRDCNVLTCVAFTHAVTFL